MWMSVMRRIREKKPNYLKFERFRSLFLILAKLSFTKLA